MDIIPQIRVQASISKKMSDRAIENARNFQSGNSTKTDKELKSVSREFESILVYKMLEAMRATVPKSELFGSFAMETFQSMMDQEVANEMSKTRGIGLADMIYKQLTVLDSKAKEQAAKSSSSNSRQKPITDIKVGGG